MSQSPRRSLNGVSPSRDRSRDRDPSFSRSRSRSSDRRDSYKYSSRRSTSPRYREERYRDDKYSTSSRRRYSRSPSYSRSRRGNRSRTRSPMSTRRRHHGSREDPSPSTCLGVFGLSIYTSERQLHHLFGKYGPLAKVQVVLDAKTGRSRGFAFIYFEHMDDATEAKEQCTGMEIDGRRIRVDYSITERAHTPTPGIYMGRPTNRSSGYGGRRTGGGSGGGGGGGGRYGGGYGSGGGGGGSRRRSPSPYRRGRSGRNSYRSRSRSYSPRFYNANGEKTSKTSR
ncbi:transformer-2 protein homolog alpha-like isoform X1 [Macrobrachium nipponense]|uniref:transformer-2 protein homolog alpha-like isoform X1 n=1 Tax=Macrobrachium nipponense TaxID=159736 RepID=UPI0030C8B21F